MKLEDLRAMLAAMRRDPSIAKAVHEIFGGDRAEELLTRRRVEREFGISFRRVLAAARTQEIELVRVGRRVYVQRAVLLEWIHAHRVREEAAAPTADNDHIDESDEMAAARASVAAAARRRRGK